MCTIGIICEYNPFHNGHLYHINKIKEQFPDSAIILILSGNYTQRGELSILNKWDKTTISLTYGIDLVVELPFNFATQSADLFSHGAINLLNELKVDYLVFGSESNDIEMLTALAKISLSKEYDLKVKGYLNGNINYPTALSKAFKDFGYNELKEPNDILGFTYIKELLKINSKIKPISIKRTNNYNSDELNTNISSGKSIRENINSKEIKKLVPDKTYDLLKNNNINMEKVFPYLKYKIISEINNLNIYQTVDEGIENKIKKVVYESNSYEELVNNIKSKRYTQNKIKRMLLHILVSFSKEEAKKLNKISYIRVLGFNENGKKYLNKIKKDTNLPIYTNYQKEFDLELRVTMIYSLITNNDYIKKEITGPIIL